MQVWDAVQEGDVARLRLHLEQGADTGTRDGEGLSLLHWAADRGEITEIEDTEARSRDLQYFIFIDLHNIRILILLKMPTNFLQLKFLYSPQRFSWTGNFNYHKTHYSKDNFWVLGATLDVYKVYLKPF